MTRNIGVFVAWPYANGNLHLGHIAGAYLPADIFARYHRLKGNNVLMVSGSDSHGTPITLKAREENSTPLGVVKKYHHNFLEGWRRLGISFDLFTHTHTSNHINITQDFFKKLHANGDLSIYEEEQYYDEKENLFLPDRYVRGNCPKCDYARARADQCENCGSTFETPVLKNPVSTISGTTPVVRKTSHYYFELGKYKDKLLAYVDSNPHWRPHVQNFTRAMIQDSLRARPITRDIDWGVSVPVEGWEKKVIYVWFDAVIGYYSAAVEWAKNSSNPESWKDWWKNPEAKGYYFIGKDNIPFHTVIWPVELMAYDSSLNLPFDVPANQFLNLDSGKFSTSSGQAVWLLETLDKYDSDALRFYITSIMPETKDSQFSWEEFVARNDGELVAAWGNLVNRVLGFAFGRFDAKVPQPETLDEIDQALLKNVEQTFKDVEKAYEEVRLRDALKEVLRLTRDVNKYLDEKAPWTQFKTDPKKAGTTTYVAMKVIDSLKILFAPILPETSEKIHKYFSHQDELFGKQSITERKDENDSYEILLYIKNSAEDKRINRFKPSELKPGTTFSKPEPLFKMLAEKPKTN